MQTVHLIISGKVQGVFFRETSRKIAEKLNIKGWIKNVPEEKVEALITGDEKNVSDFIKWCKTGPDRAKVKEVIVTKQPETFFDKFEVKRRE
jgi:acylphosphatase